VQGSDGSLYGVTQRDSAGIKVGGAIYTIPKDGAGAGLVYQFSDSGGDGKNPGPLIEGKDGVLYGTSRGGRFMLGTVFKLNKDGTGYAILHHGDAKGPAGPVIEGSDGSLAASAETVVAAMQVQSSRSTRPAEATRPYIPLATLRRRSESVGLIREPMAFVWRDLPEARIQIAQTVGRGHALQTE
jgi:hypothetical protein